MKRFIGLGDFVLDIVHNSYNEVIGYYPGSSVWNDLMNLKEIKPENLCECIATVGNDETGDFLKQEISKRGINVKNLKVVSKNSKRFNIIIDGENTKCQYECPNCGSKIWYSDAKLPKINYLEYILQKNQFGIVVFDSVKKDILGVAAQFQSIGWKLALDLGYIAHLRYMSKNRIKELFSILIDYFQTNSKVCKFLMEKLECESEKDLFDKLGCIYMNVTDGKHGSKLYYRQGENIEVSYCPAIPITVVDSMGAGDAYFSLLLSEIDMSGRFQNDVKETQLRAVQYATERVTKIGAMGKLKPFSFAHTDCKECGYKKDNSFKTRRIKRHKIATNTDYLLDRVIRAMETDASDAINSALNMLNGNIVTVGTGGSYSAAVMVAKMLNVYDTKIFAVPKHPREVLIEADKRVDAMLLFSYSGKTKDILQVYNYCKTHNIRVYIISRISLDAIKENYVREDVISYCTSKKSSSERGFLSMAGTLIPIILFGMQFYKNDNLNYITFLNNCFEKWSVFFEQLKIKWKEFSNNPVMDIFSGIDTAAAAIDLESKIVESGIGRVIVHEKKDFSHGRFNVIANHPPYAIILFDNITGKYSKKLESYLSKRTDIKMIKLTTEFGEIWGDIDLMIACQYLAKYLSRELQYDMSKPDYPEDAMGLFKYSGSDLR